MKISHFVLVYSLLAFSCNNKDSGSAIVVDTPQNIDTSNTEIYDFLKIAINTEKLDTTYRLVTKVFESPFEEDSIFLKTLLIEKKPQKKENHVTLGALDKCLTQADIDRMLSVKNKLHNFHWDSTRLNFKGTARYDRKYFFSLPLVSVDKTKFIISYGGHGGGTTVLFRKVDDHWETQESTGWSY